MTAPTYIIRTVADFLKVPAARRETCLQEFHGFLPLAEMALRMPGATGAFEFTWIDDGETSHRIILTGADGKEIDRMTVTG